MVVVFCGVVIYMQGYLYVVIYVPGYLYANVFASIMEIITVHAG